MICPRCSKAFEPRKSGYQRKFCSRTCSNSREWSTEIQLKRSTSVKLAMSRKSQTERLAFSQKGRETAILNRRSRLESESFDLLNGNLKRERILLEQEGQCAICSGPQVWNGKPLTFHLDHVSGDRSDNSRTNLRLVCPNCHSQTDTYCRSSKRSISDSELREALQTYPNKLKAFEALGLQPSSKTYQRAKRVLADVG